MTEKKKNNSLKINPEDFIAGDEQDGWTGRGMVKGGKYSNIHKLINALSGGFQYYKDGEKQSWAMGQIHRGLLNINKGFNESMATLGEVEVQKAEILDKGNSAIFRGIKDNTIDRLTIDAEKSKEYKRSVSKREGELIDKQKKNNRLKELGIN